MDSQTFLANLRQSGLVGVEELEAALDRVPPTDRGKGVARALVHVGLLTKFQAELLLAGRTSGFVLGQYRILDLLGQGGMGRVFKAEHQTMGRTVAIKVLAPQHTRTPKARQLFMSEVRAAGKLMHPNIVTAHDANEIDGRHYLVMEFIDGPNLDQMVRERGPLPVGLACDIIRQAASGLQCAFEHGMVHRDIKPSNLVLQRTGATLSSGCLVKILDFGLARLGDPEVDADHAPPSGGPHIIMGTPDYLSPEQSRNLHLVDIRSDLYSLGCAFYYLLAGQVPFPGGSTVEKLRRHATERPAPIEQFRPEIPLEVADIVHCLLAKDPSDRYQTPAELVLELTPLAMPVPSAWSAARPPANPTVDTEHPNGNTGGSLLGIDDKPLGNTDRHSALADLPSAERMSLSTEDISLLPLVRQRDWIRWLPTVLWACGGAAVGAAIAMLSR
jgi:eukaryotic-like serine/threonine-protein kinase